jgi:hypothetical protein
MNECKPEQFRHVPIHQVSVQLGNVFAEWYASPQLKTFRCVLCLFSHKICQTKLLCISKSVLVQVDSSPAVWLWAMPPLPLYSFLSFDVFSHILIGELGAAGVEQEWQILLNDQKVTQQL